MRDGECLVYTPVVAAETEYRAQWEAWPMPAHYSVEPLVLNLARLNALRAKKTEPDSPWETDMFYLPSPIFDRERPYYLRLAAVCQQSSGFVFAAEPSPPELSGHQSLADAICSSIERHGFLPETIFVKGAEEATALTPLANALGFTIRRRKQLKAIQMLKKDMMMQVVRGGGGRRGRRN
jgi:hypothetical protein